MTRPDPRVTRTIRTLQHAAQIKPAVDHHLTTLLHETSTQTHNETGITAQGTINDPVVNAVIRRGHIIDRTNRLQTAVEAVEHAVNHLDTILTQNQPKMRGAAEQDPVCYIAGCSDLVDHYTLKDGTVRYRMGGNDGGMCPRHRRQHQRNTT